MENKLKKLLYTLKLEEFRNQKSKKFKNFKKLKILKIS